MPKKETFTGRFEETRGGRVPQKSKIGGDVVYGWSLRTKNKTSIDYYVMLAGVPEPMHWDVGTGSHLIFGKYSNSIPIKRGRLI